MLNYTLIVWQGTLSYTSYTSGNVCLNWEPEYLDVRQGLQLVISQWYAYTSVSVSVAGAWNNCLCIS